MTPKEKAQELIERFYPIANDLDEARVHSGTMQLHNAKQCALMCVEEIINAIPNYEWFVGGLITREGYHPTRKLKYWQQVKECLL